MLDYYDKTNLLCANQRYLNLCMDCLIWRRFDIGVDVSTNVFAKNMIKIFACVQMVLSQLGSSLEYFQKTI